MTLMPRESGKLIAQLSQNVFVKEDGIKTVAQLILDSLVKNGNPCKSSYPQEIHPSPDHPRAVDWIFLIDMLNFCFWPVKWTIEKQGGYFGLCRAIKRAIDEGTPLYDPAYYSKLELTDLERIFRCDQPDMQMPLLKERLKSLRQCGEILLEKYKGTFVECVKPCKGSAQDLLKLVVKEFESFRDETDYRGHRVGIYKRAQILVADIWACFQGEGIGRFDDIASITMFADYRVPQVLVHCGALSYSDSLLKILEAETELEYGDEKEVEIRGCSIEAVERIKREVRALIKQHPQDLEVTEDEVNAVMVDYILWDYRWQNSRELRKTPYHRTRCIYY